MRFRRHMNLSHVLVSWSTNHSSGVRYSKLVSCTHIPESYSFGTTCSSSSCASHCDMREGGVCLSFCMRQSALHVRLHHHTSQKPSSSWSSPKLQGRINKWKKPHLWINLSHAKHLGRSCRLSSLEPTWYLYDGVMIFLVMIVDRHYVTDLVRIWTRWISM